MNLDEFLSKLYHFSETKGADMYHNLLSYTQITHSIGVGISVAYLLVLWWVFINREKIFESKIWKELDEEIVIAIAMVCAIAAIIAIITLTCPSTYMAIFNPEGYILSNALVRGN